MPSIQNEFLELNFHIYKRTPMFRLKSSKHSNLEIRTSEVVLRVLSSTYHTHILLLNNLSENNFTYRTYNI